MKEEILEAVEKSIIYLTNELLEALVIEEAIERGEITQQEIAKFFKEKLNDYLVIVEEE